MPTYKIRGIDVDFPFEAYDCQILYMEKVIQSLQNKCHALLESPTGTGKTLCLLCATLAWRKSLGSFSTVKNRKKNDWSDADEQMSQSGGGGGLPAIVYTSRTHSQLRQVIKELRRSSYRPKMVVLGSREQMCVNEEVRSLRGKALANACQYLCRKRGNRQCEHFNRVPDYLKHNSHLGEEPIDIEDLINIGKESGPCPYYVTRELQKDVDILFAPYNYLIDHGYRKYLKINWNNSILIFDEAHNLESLCADAASFDFPSAHLSACISEAQECVELAAARRDSYNDVSVKPENFAILKGIFLKLQELISKLPIKKRDEGFTKPGPYIYEMLEGLNITHKTAPKLIATLEEAVVLLEEEKQRKAKSNAGSRLETFAEILKLIFRADGGDHADFYRVHVQELEPNATDMVKGKVSRTFSWWCFNPGIAMQEMANKGVGSIILTSGTLSPMDSLAQELKLDFPVRLENPHVISSNQLWAGVVRTGPSGCVLNSNYQNRDSLEYKQELGNAIVNFARIVPDGLLVFFPSYYLMDKCIACWKDTSHGNAMTIWERICIRKKPVIEPKDSSLFPSAMQDFVAKLRDTSTSGAIFFAVCRGKVSEGLDFTDHAGRAVVITGLPYARIIDPKVKLKREFLDQQLQSQRVDGKAPKSSPLSGDLWYSQEAARAVNQAIGRVIRHRHDYGAIIFCDARFEHPSRQSQISHWIRPMVKCYSRYGEVISDLVQFFRSERSSFPAMLVSEQDNSIGNVNVKEVSPARTGFNRLEGLLPANRAFPSQDDIPNTIKWKGLSILPRTDKIPRVVERKDMLSCCSKKTKLAELYDEVEKPSEVIDLESDNSQKRSSGASNSSSSSCFNTVGLIRKRKVPDNLEDKSFRKNQEKLSCSLQKANETGTCDEKEASASAYLSQAQEKLDTAEYKKFIGYMQALKNKEIKLVDVMQSVVQLFSGPDRYPLLMRFKDFVPVKYRSLYEQCIEQRKD
ncbi:PREDICTED: regulator of telomere elongation helicase 1 [Tarenaya hassleriana]|uniref:regulator of telomere elongation helicase 1 n=1 Tax=Tarenaya hassleriana TaxID=28532 RepID=UPI00053C3EA8|nr:PREDICTED: regulator of telomere elongation helicase 1 [Tarenaya hassleriana]XP_010538013.1 PREDICTED: regulator of telomere elongation helicase 1 [Tarenaya hassleriana]